jgi:hypothetical protein
MVEYLEQRARSRQFAGIDLAAPELHFDLLAPVLGAPQARDEPQ